jgi:gluconolactonase
MVDDIVYPNGLCFSPDEKLLYVNCSRERLIRVYDVTPGAASHLGKGRLFYQYGGPERGVPDGMKCDTEGNVWCTGPGGIFVHDPSGKVLARVRTPGHHPTNFAWGDDDWKSLYITNIGSVVRVRANIAGIPGR